MESRLVEIKKITPTQIASICDHTYLARAEAFRKTAPKDIGPVKQREIEFDKFLENTVTAQYSPYALCVRPEDVEYTKKYLYQNENSNIIICSVVGFPNGSRYSTNLKVAETTEAIENGAKEIDMVMNYEALKGRQFHKTSKDIRKVVDTAHGGGALVKVILETSELNAYHLINACRMCEEEEVDFVKTSTGFSPNGATPRDLTIMGKYFSRGVKASGGVNEKNVYEILRALSKREDGLIELDPSKIRIGEGSLLEKLF